MITLKNCQYWVKFLMPCKSGLILNVTKSNSIFIPAHLKEFENNEKRTFWGPWFGLENCGSIGYNLSGYKSGQITDLTLIRM